MDGALEAESLIKNAPQVHEHIKMTKPQEDEHEEIPTKMSKLHEKIHPLGASDMVASKDQTSTLGGESSEVAEHGNFPSTKEARDETPLMVNIF